MASLQKLLETLGWATESTKKSFLLTLWQRIGRIAIANRGEFPSAKYVDQVCRLLGTDGMEADEMPCLTDEHSLSSVATI